ncbi:glycine oxidase ThiO [Paenibacillus filicis]|uniref:glycine oxidase n=1 Tax=Paenibacillus gyeongsangnamensis TaxID=3388067 RepID=A0ABT4Q562_9BACL|nr:glycine oxidase ThiO [Paenibacillus filicis]MCZ8511998.1 glycine oxidase ThiO [Paenibacillus filicis]
MSTNSNTHANGNASSKALIIGGGVIGCSIAYELGKAGFHCTILDKGALLQEASTAAAGMLGAQVETHHPGSFYELCRASQALYPEWVEELEQASCLSVQYIREGVLRAALTQEDEKELRSRLPWIRQAEWLETEAMLQLEPELSPFIRGGLHLPADHQVHPVWLARALRASIVRQGCRILEWTPAFSLVSAPNGRVTGVRTSEGTLESDLVILSAGAWSPALTAPLGLQLPMFPVKGQCISVKTEAPLIRSTVFTKGCYVVPKLDGSYIIGATQVEAGFDKRATTGVIADLHDRASALLPRIADSEFLGTWAGLRPGTQDGLPFLGAWEEAPGLIFATGHYRNGILLAPVTGRIIRQVVLAEKPELDLSLFEPSRARIEAAPAFT